MQIAKTRVASREKTPLLNLAKKRTPCFRDLNRMKVGCIVDRENKGSVLDKNYFTNFGQIRFGPVLEIYIE